MDLLKLLQEAQERRNALYEGIKTATTNEELDKIELDIRKVDVEIKSLEEKIQEESPSEGLDPETRSIGDNTPLGRLNPLSTYRKSQISSENNDDDDMYSSLEYRKAFRSYVIDGTPIPEKYNNMEKRADSLSVVGNVAAVIPTTIMNKVIEDITVEGNILSRVTQTSFQGGVSMPISEINPTATWLSSESADSDEQKAAMEAKISFSYHILEAKIAVGIIASTVSLPVFEATIVKNLKKAMIRALETAIVSGTGSGQPLGFTKYTLPTSQVVTLTTTEAGTVKGWAKAEAAVSEEYDDTLIYMMNKTTWDSYINSMVDSNGQKIGLGRIDEKGRKILNGREVITTDKITGMDSASAGDIVASLVNLEEYFLNSNLSMYYKKWFDEDTNKWKHKALMIADGQMAIGKDSNNNLVGAGSLVYIKKA